MTTAVKSMVLIGALWSCHMAIRVLPSNANRPGWSVTMSPGIGIFTLQGGRNVEAHIAATDCRLHRHGNFTGRGRPVCRQMEARFFPIPIGRRYDEGEIR